VRLLRLRKSTAAFSRGQRALEEERSYIAEAIHRLREGVHWRPGRDVQHLAKRIELGNLPGGTIVTD
jgi:hypothetical protein